MKEALTMKKVLAIAIWLVASATGQAQSLQGGRVIGEEKPAARLRSAAKPEFADEAWQVEGADIIYRSGVNIPLPLTEESMLRASLTNTPLTTEKMDPNLIYYRTLNLQSQIRSQYGGLLPAKDLDAARSVEVQAKISGRSAHFRKGALMFIDPQTLQIEVGPTDYIKIGERDNRPVYLKPGVWRLRLHTLIQSVDADGFAWKAGTDPEGIIRKPKTSTSNRPSLPDEAITPLAFLNPVVYEIVQLGNLVRGIFHKSNFTVPVMAELNFRATAIEATFVSPPAPKGTATRALNQEKPAQLGRLP
jgi:hypothetical protein